MIRQIHIENYKALRDVTLDLTPFHVLIGPNDSGKTSILEAVGAVCRSVESTSPRCFLGEWQGRDLVWNGANNAAVKITADVEVERNTIQFGLEAFFNPTGDQARLAGSFRQLPNGHHLRWSGSMTGLGGISETIHAALAGVRYHRFDPRRLAMPVGRSSGREFRLDPSGFGLALCLEDIRDTDDESYHHLLDHFRRIFPQIKQIQLRAVIGSAADPATRDPQGQHPQQSWGKELLIEFKNSSIPVPASQVSEGILLVLGYLTLLSLPKPAKVILIEEPETGIYPKLLHEVICILRDLVKSQSGTQVIMTTHAPYVLDEFGPEDVTVCRKDADGSISVHPLSGNQRIKDQLDIFSLGELWTPEIDAVAEPKMAVEEPAK